MVGFLYISVFVLFQVSFLLQLYYIFVVHRRLASYRSPAEKAPVLHPVSIIICARNEELKLQKNLPAILEQDYRDFEVVVVNDCSVDETHLMLLEMSGRYPNLKVVTINEHKRFKHGKKFAVTLGIKAASHENLLFTDADCVPASDQWLRLMQRNFTGSTEIVLGYSPYEKLAGFVNKLIRFETFYTALNYLSYALSGDPYMGVGRNMAYKKSLFFKGKGFASHMHIPSGDDDLFVNQNATPFNTAIEIEPEAHVWSEPKRTFTEYINQKLRHLGAGKAYKHRHKRMLSLQVASAVIFYLCLITLIGLNAQWWLLLAVFMLRLVSQVIVYKKILTKLNYADLVWWLPVFDFIYYFYILALSIVTLFKKRVQWK
ncbi:MAG TPA: glycosyltransferase [Sphingobacteriaceae bacterium]